MSVLLALTDSLKLEAESFISLPQNKHNRFLETFRLEFNYNSNHIEGNNLSHARTNLLLLLNFAAIEGEYNARDVLEMKGHDEALSLIIEAASDKGFVLTEKYIKEINACLLAEPYYRDAKDISGKPSKKLITPGDYKKLPNHVELPTGEIFRFSEPEDTRAHMGDLMEWYRKEEECCEMHPVHLAALFHYKFIRIHPFDDGNGRTVRLLMNYILLKHGYAPIAVESADKKDYFAALNKADSGDLSAFTSYFVELSLLWQQIYFKLVSSK